MDTLHSMRVFVRVIDTGSFTAAAQALDLSTAQVSRLVSELEQQLEARLLHRTTRRLALTEVGERYLQRCRQIIGEVDEAAAEARGAHLKPHGRLRVHTMTGLGLQHLTPLVARYSELYPEVVVELTLSQRTPDLLEDGHDVIITFARELPDSQMVAQLLGPMFSVLCAAPGLSTMWIWVVVGRATSGTLAAATSPRGQAPKWRAASCWAAAGVTSPTKTSAALFGL